MKFKIERGEYKCRDCKHELAGGECRFHDLMSKEDYEYYFVYQHGNCPYYDSVKE